MSARVERWTSLALALGLAGSGVGSGGCSAILDLGSYQNGTSETDAASVDGGVEIDAAADLDAATDAAVDPDAASEPDAFVPLPDAGGWDIAGDVVGLPPDVTLSFEIVSGGTTSSYTLTSTGRPDRFAERRLAPDYEVRLTAQPADYLCLVYRGEGVVAGPVDDVFIGCSSRVGLVGYYPLEGNFDPSSAVPLATWTSASPPSDANFVAGRLGGDDRALGRGGVVDLRLNESLGSVAGAGYTVSMWVRFEAVAGDYLIVFQRGAGDPTPVVLRTSDDFRFDHYVYWNGVDADSHTFSAAAAASDTWYHVVAVSEILTTSPTTSFKVHLYVDGVETARTNVGGLWETAATNWHLFSSTAIRDDVRIYRRPLNPTEVNALYHAELGHL